MLVPVEVETKCYHCGDSCESDPIVFDEQVFCCHGCKAVYELIQQSDLTSYYQGKDLKAAKVKDQAAIERKYGFLDQQEVISKLLRYHDETVSVAKFYLPGIHCSSCIYLLEHLPKLDDNILRSEVNFIRKEINITFNNQLSLKALVITLASLGYEPAINLENVEGTTKTAKKSTLGTKIAIAGFCFGNSMLISLPEYLDADFQLETVFKSLFGWINLGLALPVVLYAAQDYYRSAWAGIKHRFLNIDVPITLGILTLFVRSVYEITAGQGVGFIDSLNGLVFFLLIGKWYQAKTYQALSFERDYKSYFPVSVTRMRDGKEENTMLKYLKAGDEIVLHNLELIPADGFIAGGTAKIDYSFVTGEAEPVAKAVGEKVFAGGRQLGSQLNILLEREVVSSELAQLWNAELHAEKETNKYDALIDRVSKYFTIVILLLATFTGVYWGLNDPDKMWNVVAAVLIVACPCALALALPFGLGHGMRLLGTKGLYLKNAQVIERMAKIREIVFDKTGTLTGSDAKGLRFEGNAPSDFEASLIKSACACSAHPLSKHIAQSFGDHILKLPVSSFEEEIGKGFAAVVSGVEIKVGSASWVDVPQSTDRQESSVYVRMDNEYKGCFKIHANYRPCIFEMLVDLRKGYRLHLLSGDNSSEENKLKPYFDQLNFNQKPKDKLTAIQSLSRNTLMIGDGLNDAGALKHAAVGFSVCEDIHQFSPACDALMQADAVKDTPEMLRFSKAVMRIIVAALIISFAYNIVGLSFAITGNLTPVVSAILMPVSSVTVVGFITLMVNWRGGRIFRKEIDKENTDIP